MPSMPGQHHIEHDEVGIVRSGRREGAGAVVGDGDVVALVGEGTPHRGGDSFVVVDHEDVGAGCHGGHGARQDGTI